jgi:hypothetical protein
MIHTHAGIIGNGGQAGLLGRKARLGQRILYKGAIGLGSFSSNRSP